MIQNKQQQGLPTQHATNAPNSLNQQQNNLQNLLIVNQDQIQMSNAKVSTHRAILTQSNDKQNENQIPFTVQTIMGSTGQNKPDGAIQQTIQPDLSNGQQNMFKNNPLQYTQQTVTKRQTENLNSSRFNVLNNTHFVENQLIQGQQNANLNQGIMNANTRGSGNQNQILGQNQPIGSIPQTNQYSRQNSITGPKSQSQQKDRDSKLKQTFGVDGQPPLMNKVNIQQQNQQVVKSLGRGATVPLNLGSVNSNSTATMTVGTALSVHNSTERQASLPLAAQQNVNSVVNPQTMLATYNQQKQNAQNQYQHIIQAKVDNSVFFNPIKCNQIMQVSGQEVRMPEQTQSNGHSLQAFDVASRMSGKHSANDSRSPNMASKLLYTHEQNGMNDTQSSALRNFNANSLNNNQQQKTPQIQLPSLLQNGNITTNSQTSSNMTKPFKQSQVHYTYSNIKSPNASNNGDRDPYIDRGLTNSIFQIRGKTGFGTNTSSRKQIFSKSYASKEQFGGFYNKNKSIEVHDMSNYNEQDYKESVESVDGAMYPDVEIQGRYQDNKERRLRSIGGNNNNETYEMTTQSQNDRINRLVTKKTSLPLDSNGFQNPLSSANSEQLPTLSPSRQVKKFGHGSSMLNNISSTVKKPSIVNGIITDTDGSLKESMTPNYTIKQPISTHKSIPTYTNQMYTPGAGQRDMISQVSSIQGMTGLKPTQLKMTQAKPPHVPHTVQTTPMNPMQNQQFGQHNQMPQPASVQSNQSQDPSKLQLPMSRDQKERDGGPVTKTSPAKTFDFQYVKILLRQSSSNNQSTKKKDDPSIPEVKKDVFKEIFLEREWLKKNKDAIPHFSEVISKVKETEGVEITMNCNSDAFYWLIDIVKIQTNYAVEFTRPPADGVPLEEMSPREKEFRINEKFFEITNENCLNKLVTSHFLQIKWIYEQIWQQFFQEMFSSVINCCKISLSNLNSEIVAHIADRVTDAQLEKLKDRRDKFLSNLYRARIEQKLLRFCSSKRTFQITDYSIFYCEDCCKIMTIKQSKKISCKMEGNEHRSFINLNGELFVAHKFSDVNLQSENYHLNQNFLPSSQQTTPAPGQKIPIDMAQFIRFFRERYRLCWKEIFLKFASVSKNNEPEFCTKCCQWFRMSDLAGCEIPDRGQENKEGILKFHMIDPKTTLNYIDDLDIMNYKKQIQVIDDRYDQKTIEKMIATQKQNIKFIEPQSMNFEKKLSEAYLEFKDAMDKKKENLDGKGEKTVDDKDKDKDKEEIERKVSKKKKKEDELPIVENANEDLLFIISQAADRIKSNIKHNPEFIKKITKDVKAYIRDNPIGANGQQTNPDQVIDGYANPNSNDDQFNKRKLSPKSAQRCQKLVKKRVNELKKDIMFDEDIKSMQKLVMSLRAQRNDNEKEKDKTKKKDKAHGVIGMLDDKSEQNKKDLLSDIKIVKNHHHSNQNVSGTKKSKIFSDISQITKVVKRNKKNQNSFSALGNKNEEQNQKKPPILPPQYISKDPTQSKEPSQRAVSYQQNSARGSSQQAPPSSAQHNVTANSFQQHPMQMNMNMNQSRQQQQQPPGTQGPQHSSYHHQVWDAKDKFRHFPTNIQPPANNMRSNSQNPQQQRPGKVLRSNSISENEKIANAVQPQQFQFSQLTTKKDSSHNVFNNKPDTRQKSSQNQFSQKLIRGNGSSSFTVDQ